MARTKRSGIAYENGVPVAKATIVNGGVVWVPIMPPTPGTARKVAPITRDAARGSAGKAPRKQNKNQSALPGARGPIKQAAARKEIKRIVYHKPSALKILLDNKAIKVAAAAKIQNFFQRKVQQRKSLNILKSLYNAPTNPTALQLWKPLKGVGRMYKRHAKPLKSPKNINLFRKLKEIFDANKPIEKPIISKADRQQIMLDNVRSIGRNTTKKYIKSKIRDLAKATKASDLISKFLGKQIKQNFKYLKSSNDKPLAKNSMAKTLAAISFPNNKPVKKPIFAVFRGDRASEQKSLDDTLDDNDDEVEQAPVSQIEAPLSAIAKRAANKEWRQESYVGRSGLFPKHILGPWYNRRKRYQRKTDKYQSKYIKRFYRKYVSPRIWSDPNNYKEAVTDILKSWRDDKLVGRPKIYYNGEDNPTKELFFSRKICTKQSCRNVLYGRTDPEFDNYTNWVGRQFRRKNGINNRYIYPDGIFFETMRKKRGFKKSLCMAGDLCSSGNIVRRAGGTRENPKYGYVYKVKQGTKCDYKYTFYNGPNKPRAEGCASYEPAIYATNYTSRGKEKPRDLYIKPSAYRDRNIENFNKPGVGPVSYQMARRWGGVPKSGELPNIKQPRINRKKAANIVNKKNKTARKNAKTKVPARKNMKKKKTYSAKRKSYNKYVPL